MLALEMEKEKARGRGRVEKQQETFMRLMFIPVNSEYSRNKLGVPK